MWSPPGAYDSAVTDGTDGDHRSDRRAVRIARGFLSPSTRSRYTDAAQDRFRATFGSKPTCAVCGSRDVRIETVRQDTASTRAGAPGKTFHMRVCGTCGFVGNPENIFDYRSYEHVEDLTNAARTGTPDRAGREFHMAQMAIEILGRDGLEVLIFGAGRSFDNQHIGRCRRSATSPSPTSCRSGTTPSSSTPTCRRHAASRSSSPARWSSTSWTRRPTSRACSTTSSPTGCSSARPTCTTAASSLGRPTSSSAATPRTTRPTRWNASPRRTASSSTSGSRWSRRATAVRASATCCSPDPRSS